MPANPDPQTAEQVPVTQAEAFWSRVDRSDVGGCWPWLGGRGSTGNGYGRLQFEGRMRPATQVAWELANGVPFPAGKNACHSCDNTICVNPAHIWPGTQSDNLRDCVAKGRHGSVPQSHCQRGHVMDQLNRVPTEGGYRCRACARAATRERMRKMRARRKAHV